MSFHVFRKTLLSATALVIFGPALLLILSGCQTLQEFANLRNVRFAFDDVSAMNMAGIDVDRLRSYQDLSSTDILRLGSALSRGELPVSFDIHLEAENPQENNVQARLLRMDWELFLDDRETVSGVFNQELALRPGISETFPIHIEMDLIQFFGNNLQDLVNIALGISGQGGEPVEIKLRATPTIDTVVGPIRYPQPLTLIRKQVGAR